MALFGTCMYLCVLFDTFVTFPSWISEIIKDGANLASGEILAVAVVTCGFQLLFERRIAVDPAHQVASRRSRVAVGEVEHGKFLFGIASYFHCR